MAKNGRFLPLLFGGLTFSAYVLRRQLLAQVLSLPPVKYRVRVQRGLRVPMRDGVTLAADHYQPLSDTPLPTILIRTPYARGGIFGFNTAFTAPRFAERGYHVICQDVRGRFDSDGDFEPYVHEAVDGVDTLRWITKQPWSDGKVGTWGASYVGYVQWALALSDEDTAALHSMVLPLTRTFLGSRGNTPFHLDRTLRWVLLLDALHNEMLPAPEKFGRMFHAPTQDAAIAPALAHLPLADFDEVMLRKQVPFVRQWQAHPPQDAYWQAVDLTDRAGEAAPPALLIAGWYDIFLDGQLADYTALQAAGKRPYLTVGPWHHYDLRVHLIALQEGLGWVDAHLKGERHRLRASPVRLYVMGAEEWREYPSWPPPASETRYHLHENGRLAPQPPAADSPPDQYRYDPAYPTPHVGGPLLSTHAGPQDNRKLEARDDVMTYTTPPLAEPLEIIGPVTLDLYARSSLAHTDFFGRLCVVDEDGRSTNLCDGILRVTPERVTPQPGGLLHLHLSLWATAYRFRAGQHLRLQVSSGAHPRYARNLGNGESEWTATTMQAADQMIFHDAARPSALLLPVTT